MGIIRQEFIDFLRSEMQKRGWNQADLARAARISPSGIGAVINGLRPAGPEVCNGIARAFHLSATGIFIKAGLMDPDLSGSELVNEITHKASLLSKEKQQILIQLLDGLLAGEKIDK